MMHKNTKSFFRSLTTAILTGTLIGQMTLLTITARASQWHSPPAPTGPGNGGAPGGSACAPCNSGSQGLGTARYCIIQDVVTTARYKMKYPEFPYGQSTSTNGCAVYYTSMRGVQVRDKTSDGDYLRFAPEGAIEEGHNRVEHWKSDSTLSWSMNTDVTLSIDENVHWSTNITKDGFSQIDPGFTCNDLISIGYDPVMCSVVHTTNGTGVLAWYATNEYDLSVETDTVGPFTMGPVTYTATSAEESWDNTVVGTTNPTRIADVASWPGLLVSEEDSDEGSTTITLSNVYTDQLLFDDTLTKLNDLDWTGNFWSTGEKGCNSDGATFPLTYWGCDGPKIWPGLRLYKRHLKIIIRGTEKGYVYTWDVTHDGTTTPYSEEGTGGDITVDLGQYEPVYQTGEEVEVSAVQINESASGGRGTGGRGNNGPPGGPGPYQPQSFALKFVLGYGTNGIWAGQLKAHEEEWTTNIVSPSSLRHVELAGTSQVVTNTSGELRQVLAPQALADIVTDGATGYHIDFYARGQVGALSNGLHTATGSPYLTWTIANADGTGAAFDQVNVIETRGATSITNSWFYDATSSTWTLLSGNGLRKQTKQKLWMNPSNYVETAAILNPADDSILSQTIKKYHLDGYSKRLVEQINGTGTSTNWTRYFYSDDTNAVYFGELIGTSTSGGAWTTNEYNGLGLVTATYSGFQDQAPTKDGNLCRKTSYAYDADGFYSSVTVTVKGVALRTVSYGESPNQRTETVTALGAAAQTTTTTRIAAGAHAGRLESITRPDGTKTLFSYAHDATSGYFTNTVDTGEPNGVGSAIVAGVSTVDVLDELGTLVSRKTSDIASGIVIRDQSLADFDDFRRAGQYINHLADYTNLVTYICCGTESITGKDGLTTTYGYDDLKRVISTTQRGISQIREFDAANQLLRTIRQGTDASQIVQQATSYDELGRPVSSTNAVGDVTGYSYGFDGSGHAQTTTTLPSTGTRISTSYLDGSQMSVGGTATYGVRYEYGVDGVTGQWTKEIKQLPDDTDSQEWVQNWSDGLGRGVKTSYPDTAYSQRVYNNSGQLRKSIDPDGVTTLYQYNGQGQLEYSAVDMNQNGAIDFGGTDRITQSLRSVGAATAFSGNAHISETRVWSTDNVNSSIVVSRSESAVDGTKSARITHGLTNVSETACGANCTATATAPDGSYTETVKTNGYLASVTRYDASDVQLSSVSYEYDEHGRRKRSIDARNGTTSYIFDDADRATAVTTPIPAAGQAPQTSTTYYDNMGRGGRVVQPDGASVTNEYHLTGELKRTSGARTYPVEYTYDYTGRMKTMTTWKDFSADSGRAITTWFYDSQRGHLTSKEYDDGKGPSYTYRSSGKLNTRTWKRGITTTYGYDNGGGLTSVDYSDTTADITYGYDRRGRQTSVVQGAITTTKTYNDAGQMLTESYSGGPLNGVTVTNTYDALLRRSHQEALQSATSLVLNTYGYDDASRLQSVTKGSDVAKYSYLANSPLVEEIAFVHSGTTNMTTVKAYDAINRLTAIAHTRPSLPNISFDYGYNAANQRTNVTHADNSSWTFGYDNLGQVSTGKKRNGSGSLYAGLQYEYDYDDIGNRKEIRTGGDASGGSLRTAKYTANALNQYEKRDVPGFVEVQGSAATNATVKVNGRSTDRLGGFYRRELFTDNSAGPVSLGITNTAVIPGAGAGGADLLTTETGNKNVPSNPESFTFDDDGNTLTDSLWNYTWNGENRLIELESNPSLPSHALRKLIFTYDHQGRRTTKTVYDWDTGSSSYLPISTNLFVYDGWNLLAELSSSNTLVRTYAWGLDLSGSEQGAGGVGGALFLTLHSDSSSHVYAHDGNGNVMALVNSSTATETASYEYSPFGKLVKATGSKVFDNPIRFSGKYQDDATGFNYYGYRFYNPDAGRWLNRDPIGEVGGLNLFAMVSNQLIDVIDADGRLAWVPILKWTCSTIGSMVLGGVIVAVLGDECDEEGQMITKTRERSCRRVCVRNGGIHNGGDTRGLQGKYLEYRNLICEDGEFKVAPGALGQWRDLNLADCSAPSCSTLGNEWTEYVIYGVFRP